MTDPTTTETPAGIVAPSTEAPAASEPAPTPAEAAAPAAATDSSPDAGSAVPSEPATSEEPASPEGAVSEAAEPPSPPPLVLPEFSFESWNEDLEAVPEPLRDFVGSANTWAMSRQERAQAELRRDLELYRSLASDDSEAAVAKLREEYTGRHTELETQLQAAQAQVKQYEADQVAVAEREADRWFRKHQAALTTEDARKRAFEYMESGIDPDSAVALLGEPKEVVTLVQRYMETYKVPSELAVRLAMADVSAPHGEGRDPVALPPVAGSEPGSEPAPPADTPIDDPSVSDAEARRRAVLAAVHAVGG